MRHHAHGLTVLLIATLAGCGGNSSPPPGRAATTAPFPSVAPHGLVFKATGTANVTSATYELDGARTTQKSIKLPFQKAVDIPADGRWHKWSLTMTHGSGRVDLTATVDGALAGQSTGQADGGTGTVSVEGGLQG
jgi:hypothetical protein